METTFFTECRCASREHSGLAWGAIFEKMYQNKEIHTFWKWECLKIQEMSLLRFCFCTTPLLGQWLLIILISFILLWPRPHFKRGLWSGFVGGCWDMKVDFCIFSNLGFIFWKIFNIWCFLMNYKSLRSKFICFHVV